MARIPTYNGISRPRDVRVADTSVVGRATAGFGQALREVGNSMERIDDAKRESEHSKALAYSTSRRLEIEHEITKDPANYERAKEIYESGEKEISDYVKEKYSRVHQRWATSDKVNSTKTKVGVLSWANKQNIDTQRSGLDDIQDTWVGAAIAKDTIHDRAFASQQYRNSLDRAYDKGVITKQELEDNMSAYTTRVITGSLKRDILSDPEKAVKRLENKEYPIDEDKRQDWLTKAHAAWDERKTSEVIRKEKADAAEVRQRKETHRTNAKDLTVKFDEDGEIDMELALQMLDDDKINLTYYKSLKTQNVNDSKESDPVEYKNMREKAQGGYLEEEDITDNPNISHSDTIRLIDLNESSQDKTFNESMKAARASLRSIIKTKGGFDYSQVEEEKLDRAFNELEDRVVGKGEDMAKVIDDMQVRYRSERKMHIESMPTLRNFTNPSTGEVIRSKPEDLQDIATMRKSLFIAVEMLRTMSEDDAKFNADLLSEYEAQMKALGIGGE